MQAAKCPNLNFLEAYATNIMDPDQTAPELG